MSFADEVAAVKSMHEKCKTCRILREQPDADEIRAYMDENPEQSAVVAKVLTARGFSVEHGSVRSHFRGGHDLR